MKKSLLWVIGLLVSASFMAVSCDETNTAVDPYVDWELRNQNYLDSISKVAKSNPEQWKVIHTYKFNAPVGDLDFNVNDYVYCKVLEEGTGTIKPYYTDSVTVHYRGSLIPLADGTKVVFDETYRGEFNKDVAVPVGLAVDAVIEGWTTALQEMREGDRWEVYIPFGMAYGDRGSSSVPGYSTLIFDMSLAKIYTNR